MRKIADAATAPTEDVLLVQLLDNPSFEEALPEVAEGELAQVPWWRSTQGEEQLLERELEDGTKETWLWVRGGVSAEQPSRPTPRPPAGSSSRLRSPARDGWSS